MIEIAAVSFWNLRVNMVPICFATQSWHHALELRLEANLNHNLDFADEFSAYRPLE